MDLVVKFTVNGDTKYVDVTLKKRLILRATYQIIGMYNAVTSMWLWSWAHSQVERDLVSTVKSQITAWKPTNTSRTAEQQLYYASNATFFVSYKQIPQLIQFIKTVCDYDCIIVNKHNNGNIEYIGIVNIVTRDTDESISAICL